MGLGRRSGARAGSCDRREPATVLDEASDVGVKVMLPGPSEFDCSIRGGAEAVLLA